MGWDIDYRKIDAELEKLRKTLNMQNVATNSVFDPEEATEEQLKEMERMRVENESANQGLEDEIKKLGMQIEIEMQEIAGQYNDEISLLNQIGGKFFQCVPTYETL